MVGILQSMNSNTTLIFPFLISGKYIYSYVPLLDKAFSIFWKIVITVCSPASLIQTFSVRKLGNSSLFGIYLSVRYIKIHLEVVLTLPEYVKNFSSLNATRFSYHYSSCYTRPLEEFRHHLALCCWTAD